MKPQIRETHDSDIQCLWNALQQLIKYYYDSTIKDWYPENKKIKNTKNPGEVLFVMQFPHDNDTAAIKLIINDYYNTCM